MHCSAFIGTIKGAKKDQVRSDAGSDEFMKANIPPPACCVPSGLPSKEDASMLVHCATIYIVIVVLSSNSMKIKELS
jgi:hypothetical protein